MLYSKNPPRFMTAIIIVILVSMVAAVALAGVSEKSEVIRGAGIIQSADKTYIMSMNSGKIDDIFVKEGQYAEEGDVLVKISVVEWEAQLEMYANLTDYFWGILGGYVTMNEKVKRYDITKDIRANSNNQNPFDIILNRFMYIIYESFLEQMSFIEADDNHTLIENRQSFLDQTLKECNQMILQYEPTYKQTLYQKEYLQTIIEESNIRAPISGIVHFETILNKGVVISANALIISISNEVSDRGAIVILQLPVAYRPYLSEDCLVLLEVVGYPSTKFGKLDGKITEISSDSTVDASGNIWFTAIVNIEETMLRGKDGSVQVVNGMMITASIIYEESTWLEWLLKGFGIL